MNVSRGTIRHFDYIDAVRGLAFLWVLTLHCALCLGPFPLRWIFLHGIYGVQLFFLASAFTLKASWEQRSKVDRFPVIEFYARRLLRIAPMFWLAAVFYSLVPDAMPRFWLDQFAPDGVRPAYYVLTALFLHGFHPYTFNSIVPGGWSIAVEVSFYVLCPLCLIFLGTPRRTAAAALACLWAAHYFYGAVPEFLRGHFFPAVPPDGVFQFWEHLWFPSQAAVFMMGFCVYYLTNQPQVRRLVEDRFWALVLLATSLLALWGLIPGDANFTPIEMWVVVAMGCAVIALSGNAVPILSSRLLRHIGTLSYSCYLVHFAALGLALRILNIRISAAAAFADYASPAANLLRFSGLCVTTLAITILIASVTHRLVERPGIEMGRKIARYLNGAAKPGSGTIPDSRSG
jgi:peptidoglycan/LPS O-acetylase OafA/YrhL